MPIDELFSEIAKLRMSDDWAQDRTCLTTFVTMCILEAEMPNLVILSKAKSWLFNQWKVQYDEFAEELDNIVFK